MGKLEFVDAHVHYYDLRHPELVYEHFQRGFDHPLLGDKLWKLGDASYLAEDYIAETRNANVVKAVHVQAAIGSKDPVKETDWLQATADRTGFPHAIVADASLRDPDVEAVLARHCEYPNMRGVRDFSYGDYLVEPDFHRGFALLEKYDLVASLDVQWENMGKLRDLAHRFPNVKIVLDHAGVPRERTDGYFRNWRDGMNTIAEADNIVCKISGLGLCDNDWTVDSIRPWVLHCIDAFGPERSIFASNWPVDSVWSSYDAVVDAYSEIVAGFSEDEQTAMFSGNSERLYGI